MPIYPLKNTETEEIFERVMKIAEYEQYLIENPHIQRYYDRGTPYLDPVRLGIVKPPSDFDIFSGTFFSFDIPFIVKVP